MQKDSKTPPFGQMLVHCGMGAFLGCLFALALVVTNPHLSELIASSPSPSLNMALFVGFFSVIMGTGATISGFIFTAIELNALETKGRIERFRGRGDSET